MFMDYLQFPIMCLSLLPKEKNRDYSQETLLEVLQTLQTPALFNFTVLYFSLFVKFEFFN